MPTPDPTLELRSWVIALQAIDPVQHPHATPGLRAAAWQFLREHHWRLRAEWDGVTKDDLYAHHEQLRQRGDHHEVHCSQAQSGLRGHTITQVIVDAAEPPDA